MQAPTEKRLKLDASQFQTSELGVLNQVMRRNFHRNSRVPQHGHNMEGGEG